MGCKDANENGAPTASGSAINENLVSFHHEKTKNMDFIKKHKICIIYAAQHTLKLVPCVVLVQSMELAKKGRKAPEPFITLSRHERNCFGYGWPTRSITLLENLESRRVYLSDIIYAVLLSPSFSSTTFLLCKNAL